MIMLSFFLIISAASAKEFGTYGPVYPITERNPVEVIHNHLTRTPQQDVGRLLDSAIDAEQVSKLSPGWKSTRNPRRFQYDPTYVISKDIQDPKGCILFKKGERVDPLALQPMEKTLLFIDGRDTAQVDWALSENPNNSKLILVAGSPKSLMTTHQVPFYLDQGGHLLTTFGIKQIPAVVTISQGEVWVEELKLEDNDD